jgi:hypothetical protein
MLSDMENFLLVWKGASNHQFGDTSPTRGQDLTTNLRGCVDSRSGEDGEEARDWAVKSKS